MYPHFLIVTVYCILLNVLIGHCMYCVYVFIASFLFIYLTYCFIAVLSKNAQVYVMPWIDIASHKQDSDKHLINLNIICIADLTPHTLQIQSLSIFHYSQTVCTSSCHVFYLLPPLYSCLLNHSTNLYFVFFLSEMIYFSFIKTFSSHTWGRVFISTNQYFKNLNSSIRIKPPDDICYPMCVFPDHKVNVFSQSQQPPLPHSLSPSSVCTHSTHLDKVQHSL